MACAAAAASEAASHRSCCRWRHVHRGLLPATYVISLAVHPRRPATMYAGTIWRGVAKSVDGGGHWQPTGPFPLLAEGAVPRPPDVMSLAADPAAPDTIYAGTNFGGVLKTVDGGVSWRTANRGLPSPPYFRARVFDPVVSVVVDPEAPQTLYAALTGTGVFVSRDGAAHWRRFGRGLTEPRVESLALAPTGVYAATAGGVFMNTGEGWRQTGLRGRWLETIAVDTKRPQIVYAGGLHDGVFTSRDGGRSWRATNAGLRNLYVRTLLVDSRRSGHVYAGTYGGVFASTDAGATWSELNAGLGNRLVQALALVPGRSPSLYAGTLGSGVFVLEMP